MCPQCAVEADGGKLPGRTKCTERCPLPGCRHPGKRPAHHKDGCDQCEPNGGCNALAAAVREAAAGAAAAAAEAGAAGDGEGALFARQEETVHGDDVDYELIEVEAEEEANEGLLRSLSNSLGPETMSNFIDLVADAQGSHPDELGAISLELEYIEEDNERDSGGSGGSKVH